MKKQQIFFVLLFLCHSVGLLGQGWERLYPTPTPSVGGEVTKVLATPGGGFLALIFESANSGTNSNMKVIEMAANGDVLTIHALPFTAIVEALDFIALSDGGYALLWDSVAAQSSFKRSMIAKLGSQFQVLFVKDLPLLIPGNPSFGQQLVESSTGLWVLGQDNNGTAGIAARFDLTGNTLGVRAWGLPNAMQCYAALATTDGGTLGVGYGFDGVVNDGAINVTRFNPDGSQILWSRTINEAGVSYIPRDIVVAPDGGYLLAGSRNSLGLLIKLDELGNIVWQKNFPYSQAPDSLNFLGFSHIVPTADGTGYWATGPTDSYIPQIVLLRLDLQGNRLWDRAFGPFLTYNYSNSLLALPDGGCLIGGYRDPQRLRLPYVIRTTATGQTYLSGISGTVTADLNGDCIAEPDSLLYGALVQAFVNGQLVNLTTVGVDGKYNMGLDTGNYQIIPQMPGPLWSSCTDTLAVQVVVQDTATDINFVTFYNPQPVDSLYGYVFEDYDGDCIKDAFEPGYPGWSILAIITNQGAWTVDAVTDANGYFRITNLNGASNASSGTFSISPPAGNGLNCTAVCPQSYVISFGDSTSYQANFGLHCDSLPPCPVMEVDIAASSLRVCQPSNYYVQYCNKGAVPAQNASIEIDFDPRLPVISASIPWTAVNGNTYTFPLGTLASASCGNFIVEVMVPCDEPLGTTYCVEAHAYPDTACATPGANWDRSEIKVTAECTGDSVFFTLKNIGVSAMLESRDYVVIEDNVLLMTSPGQFQLAAGEEITVAFAATGRFLRMQAEQADGFPGLSNPVAWVEGCGTGTLSLGFVNQYPLGDAAPWVDVFCLQSVNSYDPNDKQGFPLGIREKHYIEQNTEIEYFIRFQNTGTAPALYVEIRDTIPVLWLDPTTVRPGASSHNYIWDMQGNGVVVFRFPEINLPDSAANLVESQGFVKFRVSQRANVPLETPINNTAAIYFDNNAPILTNQTLHTVGKNFLLVDETNPVAPNIRVKLAPQPITGQAQITVEGLKEVDNLHFMLFSAVGVPVLNGKFADNTCTFETSALPVGIYFYKIQDKVGRLVAAGKAIKLQ